VPYRALPVFAVLTAAALFAQQEEAPIVFKSEVALARVDAQVLDRSNRPITGLEAEDFVVIEKGERRDIKNFAREEMPIDIVLLLDVSGSMQTHVASLASAGQEALNVLRANDRVAIMVFDRASRVRMPFRSNRNEIQRGLDNVIYQEGFDGGTDVLRGILDAAEYLRREGRREARRAIVILTDDQTERDRDERRAGRALAEADAVLSAILVPDAMRGRYGSGGSWPRGGGSTWPGGGGMGGPLGDIIFGRRGPYGGRRMPGGGTIGSRTQSAGSAEIARSSGGDSMNVDDASVFQTTLERLRQRYALHYNAAGDGRDVEIQLTSAAQRRYPNAEVRYRRVSQFDEGAGEVQVSRRRTPPPPVANDEDAVPQPRLSRRRPAVNEPQGDRGATTTEGGGWRRADEPAPAAVEKTPAPPAKAPAAAPNDEQPRRGGWRKLEPGEQP
jgi:VWFA-related protein